MDFSLRPSLGLGIGIVLLWLAPALYGQVGLTIRGKINDAATGEGLYDAAIGLKGQNIKVYSGNDGEFAMNIPNNFPSILEISLEGYKTQYHTVNSGGYIEANLQQSDERGTGRTSEVVRIFGNVKDVNGLPLRNANVVVQQHDEDRAIGTESDKEGAFYLFFNTVLPVVIEVSSIGYQGQRMVIDQQENRDFSVTLAFESVGLEEVIIRGAKIEEERLKADYSIEKLDVKELQLAPSFDFYDAIAGMKDVDVATQSMQFQSINARGFNSTGNVRFTQMVDGMDNQAPGFGFPVGNFVGVPELDIESIELIPGPSTAQYGLNVFNGILLMNSKDPFLFQGLSGSLKLAANRFPEGGGGQDFFDLGGDGVYDFSVRYAKAVSERLAFKTNFSVIKATDWAANDFDNIGEGKRFERHPDIPGYDGINVYGDEVKAALPLGSFGSDVIVTRTGYKEENLFDYDFTNYKLNAAVHYKITDKVRAIVQGSYGAGNTVYSGANRLFLNNFKMFQGKAEISSDRFRLKGYMTKQETGNSYDGRFLALQLMRTARSDQDWFDVYQAAYEGLLISRGVIPGDHAIARATADSDLELTKPARARLEPGTEEYNEARNRIINTTGFEDGAGVQDNTTLYHVDATYDFTGLIDFVDLTIGGNFRFFDPESAGLLFHDSAGNDITMFEYGGFVQASKLLMSEKLKLTGSIRMDRSENFNTRYTPRISGLYTYKKDHNFRLSFQTGYRFPSLREQHSMQAIGSATVVGGLQPLLDPLALEGSAFYEQALDDFNQAVNLSTNPDPEINPVRFNQEQAELEHLDILENGLVQEGEITKISPEQIRTIEIGYKSVLSNNRLLLDLTYYHNFYEDFIGIVRVHRPKTNPGVDLFTAAGQVNNSNETDVFFIYNNAREQVRSQGISFNIDYTSNGGFLLGLNGAWAELSSDPEDPIVPGFNTPRIKLNYTIGHNNITKHIGFKINLRTRTAFQWESNFGDGEVKDYFNMDVQMNWRIPSMHSMLKVGMSNLGNSYYANIFGGPRLGSLPYIQLIYDPMFY